MQKSKQSCLKPTNDTQAQIYNNTKLFESTSHFRLLIIIFLCLKSQIFNFNVFYRVTASL